MCAKLYRTGDKMLTISTEFQGEVLFVRLKGELTKDSIYKFDKKVINKLNDFNIFNIVFNVTNLKYIDFKGINKLLQSYELLNDRKGITLLCGNNINICNKLKKRRLLNYIKEVNDEFNAFQKIILRNGKYGRVN